MIIFYKQLISENKAWLIKAAWLLLIGMVAGAVAYFTFPEMLNSILEIFEDKFKDVPDMSGALALDIFRNNLIASSIALFGGIVFGLTPFFAIFFNGYIIGFILLTVLFLPNSNFLENLVFLSLALIPHGVFELPAFILATGFGFSLGLSWASDSAKNIRLEVFRKSFANAFKIYPLIVILLLIAAFIEVFITGRLIG